VEALVKIQPPVEVEADGSPAGRIHNDVILSATDDEFKKITDRPKANRHGHVDSV